MVAIKDIIGVFANGLPLEIRKFVQPVPVVMDHADALDVVGAVVVVEVVVVGGIQSGSRRSKYGCCWP